MSVQFFSILIRLSKKANGVGYKAWGLYVAGVTVISSQVFFVQALCL